MSSCGQKKKCTWHKHRIAARTVITSNGNHWGTLKEKEKAQGTRLFKAILYQKGTRSSRSQERPDVFERIHEHATANSTETSSTTAKSN